jgi:hypothetical protein
VWRWHKDNKANEGQPSRTVVDCKKFDIVMESINSSTRSECIGESDLATPPAAEAVCFRRSRPG